MSDRLEGFDNLPELQCNYCGVVFKGNHDCDYDILKERVEELEKHTKRLEEKNIKLKNNTDHRISVRNNNLKRENQRYRKTVEDIRDVMEYLHIDMTVEHEALKKIDEILKEHYSSEVRHEENTHD